MNDRWAKDWRSSWQDELAANSAAIYWIRKYDHISLFYNITKWQQLEERKNIELAVLINKQWFEVFPSYTIVSGYNLVRAYFTEGKHCEENTWIIDKKNRIYKVNFSQWFLSNALIFLYCSHATGWDLCASYKYFDPYPTVDLPLLFLFNLSC